jgi:hypothetical protein
MADNGSILVTGPAGQLGAIGRTVTGLLLGDLLEPAPTYGEARPLRLPRRMSLG